MKPLFRPIAAVLLLVLLAACSPSPEDFHGRWSLDEAATLAANPAMAENAFGPVALAPFKNMALLISAEAVSLAAGERELPSFRPRFRHAGATSP